MERGRAGGGYEGGRRDAAPARLLHVIGRSRRGSGGLKVRPTRTVAPPSLRLGSPDRPRASSPPPALSRCGLTSRRVAATLSTRPKIAACAPANTCVAALVWACAIRVGPFAHRTKPPTCHHNVGVSSRARCYLRRWRFLWPPACWRGLRMPRCQAAENPHERTCARVLLWAFL